MSVTRRLVKLYYSVILGGQEGKTLEEGSFPFPAQWEDPGTLDLRVMTWETHMGCRVYLNKKLKKIKIQSPWVK